MREHLLAGVASSEHRAVAVAFVQFSGTDQLLATGGPQALADALDECVRNVQEACRRHGVTFFETDINADGGKIMLVAGAPAAVAATRSGSSSRPGSSWTDRVRCRSASGSTRGRSTRATSARGSGVRTR